MANGRLGKANVDENVTATVYTNSSGAEASVSIIAHSKDGSDMHLRIDDGTDSLTTSTTIATETYSENILRYNVDNTGFSDPTATYNNKYSFADTTTNANFDQVFEAYVNSTSTTYSRRNMNASFTWNASQDFMPYESFLDIWGENTNHACIGNSNNMRNVVTFPLPLNADEYYKRYLIGNTANSIASNGMSYYTFGMSFDNWEKDYPWGFGFQGNGYANAITVRPSDYGNVFNSTASSSSWVYQRINSGWGASEPSTQYNRKHLHCSYRVACVEDPENTNRIGLNYFRTDTWDEDTAHTGRANGMVEDADRRMIRFGAASSRRGGNIVYFQYNPTDNSHYICVYDGGNYRLNRLDYAEAFEGLPTGTYDKSWGSDAEQYGIYSIDDDLNLTIASPFEFSLNQDNTARCTFIGTKAKPLWALCFSRFDDLTAADVYYSTDLKTWTPSATYYGSNDYEALVDQTNIVSTGGVVTATKSNIANIGEDGVLEYGTSFNQYERTGLVLSNGDRIVTYNSSTKPYTIQVMGYEGA